MYLRILW